MDPSSPSVESTSTCRLARRIPREGITFEELSFDSLVLLYTHSAFLQYGHLMDRVFGRLKGKYHDALPTIDEIKTFAAFVPPLFDYSVRVLAHEMTNPWACNSTAYMEYAKIDQAFEYALDKAVKDLLAHRVKGGKEYYATTTDPEVQWSQNYSNNLQKFSVASVKLSVVAEGKVDGAAAAKNKKCRGRRGGKSQAKQSVTLFEERAPMQDTSSGERPRRNIKSVVCFKCGEANHIARKCQVEDKDPICFRCGVKGHFARDCDQEPDDEPDDEPDEPVINNNMARAARICYDFNEKGQVAKNRTINFKKSVPKTERQPVICYNCGEEGHLARNCIAPRADSNNGGARDTSGCNRNFRRAQRDRVANRIEVTGNGEGLRTCDSEVRKGELTCAGLVI